MGGTRGSLARGVAVFGMTLLVVMHFCTSVGYPFWAKVERFTTASSDDSRWLALVLVMSAYVGGNWIWAKIRVRPSSG